MHRERGSTAARASRSRSWGLALGLVCGGEALSAQGERGGPGGGPAMASFWDPKPSPKGQGAQDLLAGVMADGDITPKEGGAEVPALAVKPKVKKEKKDAVAMMKALKEQQNAKKKAEADAAAAEAAAEAERNVDVQDAGPYGDTALGNKGAAVTALVRKQAATAEQPGMNGWKDNLKMVYEEGVITGSDPDAADDVRAELPRAKSLPSPIAAHQPPFRALAGGADRPLEVCVQRRVGARHL